jgi:peptidoglycan/LPS O-acetylase OafA/YrhL
MATDELRLGDHVPTERVPVDEPAAGGHAGGARPARWVALDGVRGIAVVLVMLFHAGTSMWVDARMWLAQGGPLGVHLFFVLSGFLITMVLLDEADRRGGIDLRGFAGRRARRLLPALLALLLVLAALAAFRRRLEFGLIGSSAIYVLTFTSNWQRNQHAFPMLESWFGPEGLTVEVLHTWSVAIEVHFYIVWAISLWLAVRRHWSLRRITVLTAVAVLAIVVGRIVAYCNGVTWLTLYFMTWSRLDAPLVGALAALGVRAGWLSRRPSRLTLAGTVGIVAFVAAAFLTDWRLRALPLGLYTALALVAAATIAAVVVDPGSGLARALSWRPLLWLGTVSYSLYVWHYPIFWTVQRRHLAWPQPLPVILGVVVSLAVAAASYRWIEQPFLRRRRRSTGGGQFGGRLATRFSRSWSQGDGTQKPSRWAQDAPADPASTTAT